MEAFSGTGPIYDVATGPQMLPYDAVGVIPCHAGSGPKSWGGEVGRSEPPSGVRGSAISSDLRAVGDT